MTATICDAMATATRFDHKLIMVLVWAILTASARSEHCAWSKEPVLALRENSVLEEFKELMLKRPAENGWTAPLSLAVGTGKPKMKSGGEERKLPPFCISVILSVGFGMATETTFGRALDRYRPTRDYRVGHYKLRVRGSQTPEAILRVFTRAAIVFREPAQLLLTIIELLVHSPVPPSPLKECIRYCSNQHHQRSISLHDTRGF
jgi:hypothetical protein